MLFCTDENAKGLLKPLVFIATLRLVEAVILLDLRGVFACGLCFFLCFRFGEEVGFALPEIFLGGDVPFRVKVGEKGDNRFGMSMGEVVFAELRDCSLQVFFIIASGNLFECFGGVVLLLVGVKRLGWLVGVRLSGGVLVEVRACSLRDFFIVVLEVLFGWFREEVVILVGVKRLVWIGDVGLCGGVLVEVRTCSCCFLRSVGERSAFCTSSVVRSGEALIMGSALSLIVFLVCAISLRCLFTGSLRAVSLYAFFAGKLKLFSVGFLAIEEV